MSSYKGTFFLKFSPELYSRSFSEVCFSFVTAEYKCLFLVLWKVFTSPTVVCLFFLLTYPWILWSVNMVLSAPRGATGACYSLSFSQEVILSALVLWNASFLVFLTVYTKLLARSPSFNIFCLPLIVKMIRASYAAPTGHLDQTHILGPGLWSQWGAGKRSHPSGRDWKSPSSTSPQQEPSSRPRRWVEKKENGVWDLLSGPESPQLNVNGNVNWENNKKTQFQDSKRDRARS